MLVLTVLLAAPEGGECGAIERLAELHAGFDQAIVSWNARTPPGSYLTVHLQARVDGNWTGWYRMGLWNTDGRPQPRTSFDDQDDEFGSVHTDTVVLEKRGDAIRARVELLSADGRTYPALRYLAVDVIDSSQPLPPDKPFRKAWGTELDVPEISQLSAEDGAGWCSAASTAMVLGYWSRKLNRPELDVRLAEAARGIHDEAWGGTGNWTFNTAYAGEFDGIRAYVMRFDSISRVEQWLASGVPVIVSATYHKMNPENPESDGHLMVLRGFTANGDPIFNDPWTRLDRGETVRRVYSLQSFADAWLGPGGSHGTAYVIHPEE